LSSLPALLYVVICLRLDLRFSLLRGQEVLLVELFKDSVLLVGCVPEPVLVALVFYILAVHVLRDDRSLFLLVGSVDASRVGVVVLLGADWAFGMHY
jgi:hypothetical protein